MALRVQCSMYNQGSCTEGKPRGIPPYNGCKGAVLHVLRRILCRRILPYNGSQNTMLRTVPGIWCQRYSHTMILRVERSIYITGDLVPRIPPPPPPFLIFPYNDSKGTVCATSKLLNGHVKFKFGCYIPTQY